MHYAQQSMDCFPAYSYNTAQEAMFAHELSSQVSDRCSEATPSEVAPVSRRPESHQLLIIGAQIDFLRQQALEMQER